MLRDLDWDKMGFCNETRSWEIIGLTENKRVPGGSFCQWLRPVRDILTWSFLEYSQLLA